MIHVLSIHWYDLTDPIKYNKIKQKESKNQQQQLKVNNFNLWFLYAIKCDQIGGSNKKSMDKWSILMKVTKLTGEQKKKINDKYEKREKTHSNNQ